MPFRPTIVESWSLVQVGCGLQPWPCYALRIEPGGVDFSPVFLLIRLPGAGGARAGAWGGGAGFGADFSAMDDEEVRTR